MKILRIIARLNMGGPARHVTLLDTGLQARGHETLLLHGAVGAGEASLEHLIEQSGIRSRRIAHLGRRISALSDARALVALVRAMFREAPDVVHTHTAKAGALGRIAAMLFNATRRRNRRCVIVHTYHGHVLDGYFRPTANRLIRTTERTLAGVTDRVITISPSQRRDIVERFAIADAQQTTVVPLGLDLTSLLTIDAVTPNLRHTLGIAPDAIVAGYIGRMVAIKDLPTLIRAFALAVKRSPTLRLLLAGDGPERQDIQRLAADIGVDGQIHMLGWTEDLRAFYATLDICVLSSINEGTPVAVIEALAAAKPVVSTSVGGVPDVVEDGVTGLLVPARDPQALSQALLRLAADPRLRCEMGRRGRDTAVRYSHVRLVDDVERLYAEALTAKRRPA